MTAEGAELFFFFLYAIYARLSFLFRSDPIYICISLSLGVSHSIGGL